MEKKTCVDCHFLKKVKDQDEIYCKMGNLPQKKYKYNFDKPEESFHFDFNFPCKIFTEDGGE